MASAEVPIPQWASDFIRSGTKQHGTRPGFSLEPLSWAPTDNYVKKTQHEKGHMPELVEMASAGIKVEPIPQLTFLSFYRDKPYPQGHRLLCNHRAARILIFTIKDNAPKGEFRFCPGTLEAYLRPAWMRFGLGHLNNRLVLSHYSKQDGHGSVSGRIHDSSTSTQVFQEIAAVVFSS